MVGAKVSKSEIRRIEIQLREQIAQEIEAEINSHLDNRIHFELIAEIIERAAAIARGKE
jgi:hypothetical protein